MIRLHGTVTAKTPISVSYPDHEGLPRTPHGEVFLNGGTFRGPLRKAAYRALRHTLAANKGVEERGIFSLAEAYMLGEGVDITNAINKESSTVADPVAEARLRELNPMLNLFGRWRISSRLAVGELRTPLTNLIIAGQGVRADMYERDTKETEYLSDTDLAQLTAQLHSERATQCEIKKNRSDILSLKKQAAKTTGKERKELYSRADEIEKLNTEIKSQRLGSTESVKHLLAGPESIAPGSEMSHEMSLICGTPTDMGLLLMALAEFARSPFLGGRRNIGFGRIEAEWRVSRWQSGRLKAEPVGQISITHDALELEGDWLENAHGEFIDSLPDFNFTVQTLDQARTAE